MSEGTFTSYTSCYKCDRRIVIDFYDNHFETEENTTFLGRLGTTIHHYCPYCGERQSGFSPYDPDQKMDLSMEADIAVPIEDDDDEWDDDAEPWWPEAEGITLIDEEEEDDDDSWDESEKVAFTCSSCGKKTRLNPKGNDEIFCYYCGKEAVKEP